MQKAYSLACFVALAALAGCEAQPTPPSAADPARVAAVAPEPAKAQPPAPAPSPAPAPEPTAAPQTGPQKFGAPITATNTVALGDIARHTSKYAKATVRTEGKVTAVCQEMGCWMEISDPQGEAHIKMAGHKFFVPKSASGRRAVVQGTVKAAPDHGACEDEAAAATGKAVKVELEATGVELM